MKKTLVAIAALAAVGAASAQSSVTLYGRIDASLASQRTSNAGFVAGARTDVGAQIASGVHTGSRWGLRGSEDLGGGLRAIFQLENGFNVDSGTAAQGGNASFGRQAFVGLSGGFGNLMVGRQYDIIDVMYGAHDAMGYSGYGAMNFAFNSNCAVFGALPAGAQGPGDCIGRQNNTVMYTTPSMGGFSAGAMWAPGENKTTGVGGSSAGSVYGLMLNYANGPLVIGGGWQTNKLNGAADSMKNWEFGGSYDLGAAKVFLQFEGSRADSISTAAPVVTFNNPRDNGAQIGATFPLGAARLMVSFARENQKANGAKYAEATAVSLMGQYDLSKRTYVYAAYLNGERDPTAAGVPTLKQRNFGVGLVHNF